MLSGVFRLYSFRKADGAKGSAGRKTIASFCLNPIASSRGQSMLLSEACSCSAERRTRGPIIEIFKLPAVSRIRVRWRPPASVPYTSLASATGQAHQRQDARKPQCAAGQAGAQNARLGINRTRPVDRLSEERDRRHVDASQSRRTATIRPPRHYPTVDYSVECNRSKRVSITGPRCKTHCRPPRSHRAVASES